MRLKIDSTPFSSSCGAAASGAIGVSIVAIGRDFISMLVSASGCCAVAGWTGATWMGADGIGAVCAAGDWDAGGCVTDCCAGVPRSAARDGPAAPFAAEGKSSGRCGMAAVVLGAVSPSRACVP